MHSFFIVGINFLPESVHLRLEAHPSIDAVGRDAPGEGEGEVGQGDGLDRRGYVVDVLQRLDSRPAAEVGKLTPRLWKVRYAGNPLRSAIDRPPGNAVS